MRTLTNSYFISGLFNSEKNKKEIVLLWRVICYFLARQRDLLESLLAGRNTR